MKKQDTIRAQRRKLEVQIEKLEDVLKALEDDLADLQKTCKHPRFRTFSRNRGVSTCSDCRAYFKAKKKSVTK